MHDGTGSFFCGDSGELWRVFLKIIRYAKGMIDNVKPPSIRLLLDYFGGRSLKTKWFSIRLSTNQMPLGTKERNISCPIHILIL